MHEALPIDSNNMQLTPHTDDAMLDGCGLRRCMQQLRYLASTAMQR
ncbi:hypothetical protein PI125_g18324 [Phytophthora idaei]|nr:hypothetical protein PI125_g18324 [Phytophthora idaei]